MASTNGVASVNEKQLAQGLGWFSIGLGLAELAAPRALARAIGAPESPTVMRALGLRELASGVGILTQSNPGAWLWSRVGGDLMDLSLLAAAANGKKSDRGRVATAAAAVLGVTALDVLCSKRMAGQSSENGSRPIRLQRVISIGRSPEDLYAFWKNFENLPLFMSHLKSVTMAGENRSRWVAKGPAGMNVEWDAETTDDQPNELIAWRSMEGSDIQTEGMVLFERLPGERGTVVRVLMEYTPPAGMIGHAVAKLFGRAPEQQIALDLHRFKQLLEAGEIARTEGQPAGRPKSTSVLFDDLVRA